MPIFVRAKSKNNGLLLGDNWPDPMQSALVASAPNNDWMNPTVDFGEPKTYNFHPQYFYVCATGEHLEEVAIHFVGPSTERILILYDALVSSVFSIANDGISVTFVTDAASEKTINLEKKPTISRSRQTHTSLVPYLTAGLGR